jgi:xanthine dehydrogenase small subunit
MSLTGFCVGDQRVGGPHLSKDSSLLSDAAISAIDGNICRCTGYKSIERAACRISEQLTVNSEKFTPEYFSKIPPRLKAIRNSTAQAETRAIASAVLGGGTDVYVQKPEHMAESDSRPLFFDDELRGIRDNGDTIEIGASATVTDLLESPVMNAIFPDLYKHLKLVSSTPIRNMATLAGNFVNASPIGDMTVWFLALDAEITLCRSPHVSKGVTRSLPLRDLYLGYKQLAKQPDEIITAIRFPKPGADFYFNFEKVCKRTYLDIATVNTAISLRVESTPDPGWTPPALQKAEGGGMKDENSDSSLIPHPSSLDDVEHVITEAHVSAGGVAPVPLYLRETSAFLNGEQINPETIAAANVIMQQEISPISDVRGTSEYKRLLLRQLFRAHFVELFATEFTEHTAD